MAKDPTLTYVSQQIAAQPRAIGSVAVSVRRSLRGTCLDRLHQSGSLRALFPSTGTASHQIMLANMSGGVTGGDRFTTEITAADGARTSVTTQAAERAYRAVPGQIGHISNTVRVGQDARVSWLPQETILFDGCALNRRLTVTLSGTAEALLIEPIVYGRRATGEILRHCAFTDRIEIRRDGRLTYLDRFRFTGHLSAQLERPAIAQGACAMASLVHIARNAETALSDVRAILPATAGASLLGPDLLVARLLAKDGFELRRTLMALISRLTGDEPPRAWMI